MGWDTDVILIAEHFECKASALEAVMLFHQEDGGRWEKPTCYLIENEDALSFYFFYERRKYSPYWIIQKMATQWPKVSFNLLGSCPDFLSGPAGFIRIQNGVIIDSYGIFDDWQENSRQMVLYEAQKFAQLIFNWFKSNGPEEELRTHWEKTYPYDWCEDMYSEKVIPISSEGTFKEKLEAYPAGPHPGWIEVELPEWKQ